MQAVAFKTKIENDVIRIPREYRGKIPVTATVTILYSTLPEYSNNEFAQTENDSWENMLSNMKRAKKIEDFKIYSKNEINER
ncbi:MAG: hypothetical protein LBC85_11120 [Fibromonadaceae bacterium]|jgi:hypothetical protein|nr:hypothetical protein [Fibromonadaceae bacterium]